LADFIIFARISFGSEKIYYEGKSTIGLMHGISVKLRDKYFKCHMSEYKIISNYMIVLLFTLFSDNLKSSIWYSRVEMAFQNQVKNPLEK
jgi:hypothetical protein